MKKHQSKRQMNLKTEIQSKYAEFQLLSQQAGQLEEQLNNLEEQIVDLGLLKNSVGELKNVKKDTEILIHLGHNLFTKARLNEAKDFIIGVGAGTLVKKNFNSTTELLANQIKELEDLRNLMRGKVSEAYATLQKIHNELENMIQEDNSS
ncbi:prefoldin subunit alpha [Candidatus Woesearchaeota archaeon]|nr:prefoldin subunit alpha [Candidatus Woesearchaeota archaeon]